MTTRYFNVKQGIQTGNVVIDAASGNVSNIGNITIISTALANLGNSASSNYFIGNGSLLTSITGANVTGYVPNATSANNATTAGTVTNSTQSNITSLGTLTGLTSTGTVNFTGAGNISLGSVSNLHISGGGAGYVLQTDGAGVLTWASAGSTGIAGTNTQVQFNDGGAFGASGAFSFNKGTNTLSVTNYSGNGAGFTYITGSNVAGNVSWAVTSNWANTANSISGTNVSGNVSDAVHAYYADTANNVSGSNVSGQVANALIAGTVYTNAQPNITSVGTLLGVNVTGNLDITGNINVTGNLNYSNVTDLVVGDPLIYLGANNTGDIWDLGFVGSYNDGTYYHTGLARDANDGVWKFFDNVVAEPTTVIDFANGTYAPMKSGTFTSTGNIYAANASLGNLVVANYFSGDGSLLTNINGGSVGNVANANFANTANVAYNVSGSNVSGNVSWAITSNWANTANSVSGTNVTGNVSDAVHAFYADVANNVSGSNVSGQVGNALVAGTVYTNAQPNITSVGTLTSLVVSGNANVGNLLTDGIYYSNGTPYDFVANAAGANTTVQFNDNDAFAGSNNFTFNKATNTLTVTNITANGAGITYITGANVSGNVDWAKTSNWANTANSVSGTNVSGNVANAVHAFNADTSVYADTANSVAGANVSGQVGNALIAGTVYTNAQPNITSVGTLSSLNVTGTTTSGTVSLNVGLTSNRSNVSVGTNTVIDQFTPSTYRTAKYIISASGDDGFQSVETLLVHDGSSSYITIYGSVCSNVSADIIELTSNVNGITGNVALYATTASSNTKVNVVVTYINT